MKIKNWRFFYFFCLEYESFKIFQIRIFSEISSSLAKIGLPKSVNFCESGDSDDFLETRNSGGSGECGEYGNFRDTDDSVEPSESSDSGEYDEAG